MPKVVNTDNMIWNNDLQSELNVLSSKFYRTNKDYRMKRILKNRKLKVDNELELKINDENKDVTVIGSGTNIICIKKYNDEEWTPRDKTRFNELKRIKYNLFYKKNAPYAGRIDTFITVDNDFTTNNEQTNN
jgi:hypothetical protein